MEDTLKPPPAPRTFVSDRSIPPWSYVSALIYLAIIITAIGVLAIPFVFVVVAMVVIRWFAAFVFVVLAIPFVPTIGILAIPFVSTIVVVAMTVIRWFAAFVFVALAIPFVPTIGILAMPFVVSTIIVVAMVVIRWFAAFVFVVLAISFVPTIGILAIPFAPTIVVVAMAIIRWPVASVSVVRVFVVPAFVIIWRMFVILRMVLNAANALWTLLLHCLDFRQRDVQRGMPCVPIHGSFDVADARCGPVQAPTLPTINRLGMVGMYQAARRFHSSSRPR